MRTLKKAVGIYSAFLLVSVINYACCGDTNFRITGNGDISVFDMKTGNSYIGDAEGVVTGAFNITVSHKTEAVAALPYLNFIPSTYALDCFETFENDLDETSLKITLNNAFTYRGNTIEPGTNLITIEELDYELSWATIFVDFTESFMSNAHFSNEVYEFTIEVVTTDELSLENTIRLSFEVD